jgi:hypothetical protein
MRQTGDEKADKIVTEIFSDMSPDQRNAMVRQIVRNPFIKKELCPEPLKAFFAHFENPVFTEEETQAFDRSIRIFKDHGPQIMLLLFFKSLPTGYLAPRPAKVLETTKLLVNQATRRVFETALYVLAVMKKDWYKGEMDGVYWLHKLRFIHSSMRVQIQMERDWEISDLGVPINQEDQALTIQLFSLAVIEGLHSMGINLSPEDRNAWFVAWRRIGREIGIVEELEPKDLVEARRLQNRICERQFFMPNQSGPPLTKALLSVMQPLGGRLIKMSALEKITRYFLRPTAHMSLKRIQKSLGMESEPSWREYALGIGVQILMNLGWWQKLMNKNGGSGSLGKYVRKWTADTLGLEDLHVEDSDHNAMEHLIRNILNNLRNPPAPSPTEQEMPSPGILSHSFDIDPELVDTWGLETY